MIAAFNKVANELADNTETDRELINVLRSNTTAVISVGGDIGDTRTCTPVSRSGFFA